MKSVILVLFALFIDGIQAALSGAILVITAFPGTFFGAAAGCVVGKSLLGEFGCSVGGFILGVLGSIPFVNGVLDVATVPIGLMLGFVFSICISCTLGVGLVTLLMFNNMFYPKYLLPGGITEILPGFGMLPTWTAITILSSIEHSKTQGGFIGTAATAATSKNNSMKWLRPSGSR